MTEFVLLRRGWMAELIVIAAAIGTGDLPQQAPGSVLPGGTLAAADIAWRERTLLRRRNAQGTRYEHPIVSGPSHRVWPWLASVPF